MQKEQEPFPQQKHLSKSLDKYSSSIPFLNVPRFPIINFPPWQSELCKRSTGIQKLHYELYDYTTFCILPSKIDLTNRKRTFIQIKNAISLFNSSFKLCPYGSCPQNLDTRYSDLDIAILYDSSVYTEEQNVNMLIEICDFLKLKLHNNASVTFIPASVSIIKLKFFETDINVDLCLNNTNGLDIAKDIKYFISNEPLLRYTIVFIKELLRLSGLNEPYKGGMSSFMLFELVVHFYQEVIKQIKGESSSCLNLGSFFINLLEYYINFNNSEKGISIVNGGNVFNKYNKYCYNEDDPYLLSVESCLNQKIDIGKGCSSYPEIKDMFYRIITNLKNLKGNVISYVNEIIEEAKKTKHQIM